MKQFVVFALSRKLQYLILNNRWKLAPPPPHTKKTSVQLPLAAKLQDMLRDKLRSITALKIKVLNNSFRITAAICGSRTQSHHGSTMQLAYGRTLRGSSGSAYIWQLGLIASNARALIGYEMDASCQSEWSVPRTINCLTDLSTQRVKILFAKIGTNRFWN
jgi:hypothetical protein